jgi:ABC-type multidrug transport system fused ATPase/permease subunit
MAVLISHRFPPCAADHILVLEHGSILQQGSRATLALGGDIRAV